MLRRGIFLFWLLIASLVTTATVHARESLDAPALECSGVAHGDGDADQSPGDSDNALPHHHGGCHGFAACVQGDTDGPGLAAASSLPNILADFPAPPRWSIGPHLRPPIA